MRWTSQGLCLLAMLVWVAGCDAPKVMEGTVTSYQSDSMRLSLKDDSEAGKTWTFSTRGADVGAEPRPGDVVRLSYTTRDSLLCALRVMNVTRQSELSGQARGGH